MLNGHNARTLVQEGKQLLENNANTSSRTARRFLTRYLDNPSGSNMVEVCFALGTGEKLAPKQYKALQAYAAKNHARFLGDGEFYQAHLTFQGNQGSPTKGTVTYTYLVTDNLENATTATYRGIVSDLVELVQFVQEFDDNPLQTLLDAEQAEKAKKQAAAKRCTLTNQRLAQMFLR